MYKNMDLLEFGGRENDYRGFGASLVRKIFPSEEERDEFCFSPRKKHQSVRKRAPIVAELKFKGSVFL